MRLNVRAALEIGNPTATMCLFQHDWFFSSWDEDVYVPIDEYSEHALPLSGMNRELLSKAEDMGKSGLRNFL